MSRGEIGSDSMRVKEPPLGTENDLPSWRRRLSDKETFATSDACLARALHRP